MTRARLKKVRVYVRGWLCYSKRSLTNQPKIRYILMILHIFNTNFNLFKNIVIIGYEILQLILKLAMDDGCD